MGNEKKGKGGRPKMNPNKKRSVSVMLCFTAAEHAKLMEEIAESNCSELADYPRGKPKMREDRFIYNPRKVLNELEAIGKEAGAISKKH
ncbi:hypothetical protein MKJ04_14250 [Pontibacter sp. E15-1]|uniref:hypothetical protein n=1 Tax=Pontibacter sp. E15-1 TaxID=2919918 RepID=UPI001F4FD222|nr:hypothetical protein [Pontibacter sp. E15-1]MCJ8166005.1 hypothetical protein [Pontibacter sp. E15-1]